MSGEQDYLERNKKTRIQHSQKVKAFLLCYDIIAVSFSFFVALWLRFDLTFSLIPGQYLNAWRGFAPIYALICIIVFYLFHLYNSVWRFASFKELQRITLAAGITCLLHIILITVLFRRMPMSYYIMGPIIQYVLIVGIRFSYRFYLLLKAKQGTPDKNGASLLIGAGEAGALVLRELLRTESVGDRVVAIEVKSGKRQMNSGIATFRERYHPKYSLVVGGNSMPLEEFFNGDLGTLLK